MSKLLLPAAYALICLAALLLAAWLSDRWRHMDTFAGWRFRPDVRTAVRRLKAIWVHDSCLGLTAEVVSAAPYELAPGLTLRAGTSSLLLATAAALTAPAMQDAERAALAEALTPIGMQPERIARRWTQLGVCSIANHEALLVQDGRQQRYFLCLDAPLLTPTHVFFDKEYTLSGAEWQSLIADFSQSSGTFPAQKYYYTGLWTENGPDALVYLGSICCRWQVAEAALSAIETLQNAGISLQEGAESLLITAVPDDQAPLQMLCEDAEPTAFADAISTLRAQWKRRNRTLQLLICLACCTCLSTIPLEMCIGSPAFVRLIALSALPLLIWAGGHHWQLKLPKRHLSVLLPAVIVCVLGALLPLTLLLPKTDFVLPGAPGIALGLLTMGTWGVQLALLLHQKGSKIIGILPLLLGVGLCLYAACTLSGPLAAAFGAVLGLLITLPLWCMRVQ